MNVLIVGSSGFIGTHLVRNLISKQLSVTTLDRRPVNHPQEVRSIVYKTDHELSEYLDGQHAVVYLRWQGYALSDFSASQGIEINVIPAIRFFEACASRTNIHTIFVSSGGAVYGPAETVPMSETHPTDPLNTYGVEKLVMEKYLHYLAAHQDLKYSILRPSSVYGPGQGPGRGQGLITTFLSQTHKRRPVSIIGDGSAVRDYLYIDDLIDAVIKILERGPLQQALNIGTGLGNSITEVIEKIENITAITVAREHLPDSSNNVSRNILDSALAQNTIGWSAHTSLVLGIQQTWNWIKRRASEGIQSEVD